jgi:hypothetical protein
MDILSVNKHFANNIIKQWSRDEVEEDEKEKGIIMQHDTRRQARESRTSEFFGGSVDGETNDRRSYYTGTSRLWREQVQENIDDAVHIDRSLSFDISNNRILASVDIQGTVRSIGVVDHVEPVYEQGLRGVYVHKSMSVITHPKPFHLRLDGIETWQCLSAARMQLLGNVLPQALLTLNGLEGTLLSFAPIGNDGQVRPRAVIALLRLRNSGKGDMSGEIRLPGVREREPEEPVEPIIEFAQQECIAWLEGRTAGRQTRNVAFALEPGQEAVIAVGLVVGESRAQMIETVALLQQKPVTVWLDETLAYLGQRLGRLTISSPAQYYAKVLTRQVELCRQSVLLGADQQFVGGFWGSDLNRHPQVWMKDTYYQVLPLCWLNPDLAQQAIVFFAQWGLPPHPWGRGLSRFPAASGGWSTRLGMPSRLSR